MGSGIDPDISKEIFMPFFTTKRAQGGTGLGLYIVYNLVTQKFGGTIEVLYHTAARNRIPDIFPGKTGGSGISQGAKQRRGCDEKGNPLDTDCSTDKLNGLRGANH